MIALLRVTAFLELMAYAVPIPTPPPIPQQYSGEQSHRWVNVQVGAKGRHGFRNSMFVGGRVLAGMGESDLSTDVMLLAGYGINDRFRFDTTMQGPGLGVECRF